MTDHLLITCAVRTADRQISQVGTASFYDPVRGYWLSDDEPLVTRREPLATKKADIETGEDMKER